jgi:hypothetical protein
MEHHSFEEGSKPHATKERNLDFFAEQTGAGDENFCAHAHE